MEMELVLWYIVVIVLGFVVTWSIKLVFIAIKFILIYAMINTVIFLAVCGISFVIIQTAKLVIKIIDTEILAPWRSFRRPQLENTMPRWVVITKLEAARNEIFHHVLNCNSTPISDPLNPHTSIVYMVGIKTHAVFWRAITIWRVSVISGRREYVSHFNLINFFYPFPFAKEDSFNVHAFCSRGVVFVRVRDKRRISPGLIRTHGSMLVFDTRYKNWGNFCLHPFYFPNVILCMGRNIEQGKLVWWQIRLVTGVSQISDGRLVLVKSTVRLATHSKSLEIINQEELLLPTSVTRCRHLRSSAHHFGVCQESVNGQRQVFLFDAKTDRFEMFPTLEHFLSSDASLSDYGNNRFDNLDSYLRACDPMVLNGREAIRMVRFEDTDDVLIMQTRLATPTLRMSSIQSLMVGMPDLASMSAKQFRELSGVDLRGE